MSRLSTVLSWARLALLLVPLFGIASAVQLGCNAVSSNDVGALKPADGGAGGPGGSSNPYGYDSPYGGDYDGYDGYDDGQGYP